jgi:hypothetical protein
VRTDQHPAQPTTPTNLTSPADAEGLVVEGGLLLRATNRGVVARGA